MCGWASNKWVSRTRHKTFVCQSLLILVASVCEISHRITVGQTNRGENTMPMAVMVLPSEWVIIYHAITTAAVDVINTQQKTKPY